MASSQFSGDYQHLAPEIEESDEHPIILRAEPESKYCFPDAPEPTLRNPWKSRDGIFATVLTASLLLLLAAVTIFVLWPVLLMATVSTLAIMAVCAVVGIAALSVVAAFGADHFCGEREPSADDAADKLLTSSYSSSLAGPGVFDSSLQASATADAGLPGFAASMDEQQAREITYGFADSAAGVGMYERKAPT